MSDTQEMEPANIFLKDKQIIPPDGWFTEEEVRESNSYKSLDELKQVITKTLPLATHRAEELMIALKKRFNIEVPIAYLTSDTNGTFHIFLLIDREDFLSPKLQAAKILTEKYSGSDNEYSIRFTFTVGREHNMSYLIENKYKLKYIHSVEVKSLEF